MNKIVPIGILIYFLFGSSFLLIKKVEQPKEPIIQIKLAHLVKDRVLQLDSVKYTNSLGQVFTISKFKYYISNIHLNSSKLPKKEGFNAYLIDEEDSASKNIFLKNSEPGKYQSISFLIGIDSFHNTSGAQSGALDAINGMFWAWNTGYIFLKLEGTTPESANPMHVLEWHIGGYQEPTNCIRQCTLNFKEPLLIKANQLVTIRLKVAIDKLMNNPNALDLKKYATVTGPENANLIAANYANMFEVQIEKK